jgi:hypothetical protein
VDLIKLNIFRRKLPFLIQLGDADNHSARTATAPQLSSTPRRHGGHLQAFASFARELGAQSSRTGTGTVVMPLSDSSLPRAQGGGFKSSDTGILNEGVLQEGQSK